ncbi:MAG TPA: recombinase family protein [Terriglobales bacterium]|nr:recombinase family protein [Terriglobales bacterium]
MARVEYMRELQSGPIDPEKMKQRAAAGWQLVALEWKRQVIGEGPEPETREDTPYGLRVADDCHALEEEPVEKQALVLMMDLLILDNSFSKVAEELNEKGFRTRRGSRWSAVSVFKMLPRLIEVAPQVFSSKQWVERRQHLT